MKGLMQDKTCFPARAGAVLLSLAALITGLLYYGLYRQQTLPQAFEWLTMFMPARPAVATQGLFAQSVPSLTHALAMMLLLHALLPSQASSRAWWRLLVMLSLLALEALSGTPDWVDAAAIMSGVVVAELLAWRLGLVRHARPHRSRWALTGLVTVSALLSAATSWDRYGYTDCAIYGDDNRCLEYKKPARPVYMSYQQLRASFAVEAARPPDQLGRIYLYREFIFLNERNQGLHVIDNTDPSAPVNIGFLRIPGNTEVAIRDGYLYADSYVDLITLDLNDPQDIRLVSRQEDIFPHDAFQSIPYNISFSRYDTDASLGVVVGYQLTED